MKISSCAWLLLAWVLWIRTEGPASNSWAALTGFANQGQCIANMKEKLNVWRQFKDAKFTANTVTFTETNTTMTYLCLPDSEDPRQKPKT